MRPQTKLPKLTLWICLGGFLLCGLLLQSAWGQVQLSPAELTIKEGYKGSYSVGLTAEPSGSVAYDINVTNSDVTTNPTTVTFTPENWDESQTVTVNVAKDPDHKDDSATITHSIRQTSEARKASTRQAFFAQTGSSNVRVFITDQDLNPEVLITPTSFTIWEGGSQTYTASLVAGPVPDPTSLVIVSASSSGNGVSVSPASYIFSSTGVSKTFTISTSEDSNTSDTSATISHSAWSQDPNWNFTPDSVSVTVWDDDQTAGITPSPPTTVSLDEGTSKTYWSPRLTGRPTSNVTISTSRSGSGDVDATSSQTFTPTNYSTSQHFIVSAEEDSDEVDDSATISHSVSSSDSSYNGYSLQSTGVSVIDNDERVDPPDVTLTVNPSSVTEGGSSTLTVSVPSSVSGNLSVSISVTGGTASTSDYSAPSSITILNGNSLATGTFRATDDSDDENNETVTLQASASNYDSSSEQTITIVDNDTADPPDVTLSVNPSSVTEGGSSTLTVSVPSSVSGNLSVSISVTGGTASTSDYSAPSSITILNGNSLATGTFRATDDSDDENNETVTLQASASNYDSSSEQTITIVDNDTADPPDVTLSVNPSSVTEGGSSTLAVSVPSSVSSNLSVSISVTGGTASTSDYSAPSSITILNGNSLATGTFRATDDSDDENNETVTLQASASNYDSSSEQTITIVDNDTDSDPPTIDSFTASRTDTCGGTLTLTWTTSDADTVTLNGSAVNADGNQQVSPTTTTSYTLVASATGHDDDTETINVTVHSQVVINTYTTTSATIKVNESVTLTWTTSHADTVTLNGSAVNADGNQQVSPTTTTSYTLVAANPGCTASDTITITFWRAPGADIDADDTTIDEGDCTDLTWTTSNANSASINRNIGDVSLNNSTGYQVCPATSRSYTLTASNPEYTGSSAATDSVWITVTPHVPPDPLITLSATSPVTEGSDSTLTATVPSNVSGDLTINIDVTGGSASSDDYTAPASITIPNGNNEATGTLDVTDDSRSEPDETIDLQATASGYQNGSATITVTDDDQAGVQVTPTNLTIDEGGSESYQVVLTSEPSDPVTITLTHSGSSDVSTPTTSLSFQPTTWDDAQTVTLQAAEDDDAKVDQASYSHSAASDDGDYDGIAVAAVSVTVTENDTAGVQISETALTVPEGDSRTYTVVLTSLPSDSVTISIAHAGDADISVDDDELVFTTADWDQLQTVTVSAAHDDDARVDTASFSHTAASLDPDYDGAAIATLTVSVETTEDETAGVQVTPTNLTIDEGGSESYQVVLTSEPSDPVTITLTHSGSGDVSTTTTSLSFQPTTWDDAQTVTLQAAEDDDAKVDQASYAHSAASDDGDYDGIAVAAVSVTVTENDTAGVQISETALTVPEGDSRTYTVVLTSLPSDSVTVSIAHAGDADISVDDDELVFTTADWDQLQTVTVSAAHDDDARVDTASFSHTAASLDPDYDGAAIATLTVSVETTEDETAGVQVTPTNLTIDEGGSESYQVVLTSEPSNPVTITLTHSGSGDVSTTTTSLTFQPTTWKDAQTVTLQAAEDDDAKVDQASYAHSAASDDGDYDGIAVAAVSVTVTENDTAGVRISETALTVPEGDSRTYTVVLTSLPSDSVTVSIAHAGDADISVDDDELVFTTADWDQLQTVTVSAAHDDDARVDTASFSHTAASLDPDYDGAAIATLTVSVETTEDETAGVQVTPTNLTIDEGGSESYQVVLTSEPSDPVTITLTHSGSGDVSTTTTSLTFNATTWKDAQTVTLQAAEDDDAKVDQASYAHSAASDDDDYDGIAVAAVSVTVIENDTAGVQISETALTVPEGDSRTYTVVLTSLPSDSVTVSIAHAGDADISVDDDELVFTTTDWDQLQPVTVSAAHDDDARVDMATFSHTAASLDPDYDGAAITTLTVSVETTEDETAGVQVTPTNLTIDEGGSDSYQVVLTSEPSDPVTITLTHSGSGDVSTTTTSLTFNATTWKDSQTVTLQAWKDHNAKVDRASYSHSAASDDGDYDGIAVAAVSVTVTENDTAGVQISETALTVPEGDSRTYTVVLTSLPSHSVTASIAHAGDADISVDDDELVFTTADWDQGQTVTVSAAHDDDARVDMASFSHTAQSPDRQYDGIQIASVSATTIDDDQPAVSIQPQTLSLIEGTTKPFTVRLDTQPSHNVTISWTAAHSIVEPASGPLTFTTANWDGAQSVSLFAKHDDDADPDKTFLTFSAASQDAHYQGLSIRRLPVRIQEDDEAGVRITPIELTVPEGKTHQYAVVLTSQPAAPVKVALSASGDPDVTTDTSLLTFDPAKWDDSQLVTIQAAQDPDAINDQATISHAVSSTDVSYDRIDADAVSVVVLEDDEAGVRITPFEMTIPEGKTHQYAVVLTSKPAAPVKVALSASGDPDVTTDTNLLTFDPAKWDDSQLVTVQAAQDPDAINDQATISHAVSSADASYDRIHADAVSVVVLEDDEAGVRITPFEMTIPEGKTHQYAVVLTSKPSAAVTVGLSLTGDPDVTTDTSLLTFDPAKWDDSQLVTIQAAQDPDAINDQATISHAVSSADASYDRIHADAVSVVVLEDDEAGVRITPFEMTIPEGKTNQYAVVLTSKPSAAVTVGLSLTGDPDVTTDTSLLTFDPAKWDDSQLVTIQAAQDPDALDDQATISHAVSSTDASYDRIHADAVSVVILDDDEAGVRITPVKLTIPEGKTNQYAVVLTSKPSGAVTVGLSLTGDPDVTTDTSLLTFDPAKWDDSQLVTVQTAQDPDAGNDRCVIRHATISADPSYQALEVGSVTVLGVDDEQAGVTIQPNPHLTMAEGATNNYTVVLDTQPFNPVTVFIALNNPEVTASVAQLAFEPSEWDQPQAVTVSAARDPDTVDDQAIARHTSKSNDGDYHQIAVPDLQITVTDTTADQVAQTLKPLFGVLGRTIAQSAQDSILARMKRTERIQQIRDNQGWWAAAYETQTFQPLPDHLTPPDRRTQVSDPRRRQVSFYEPLSLNDNSWNPVFWGQGDLQHFNGDLVAVSYRGALSAAHAGIDFSPTKSLLTGLGFQRSWGHLDYTDERGEGRLTAGINTFHPYLQWKPTPDLALWSIGGFGRGTVQAVEPNFRDDLPVEFSMVSAGFDQRLLNWARTRFSLRGDAFTVSLTSAPSHQLGQIQGRAHRGRLMLAGDRTHQAGQHKFLSIGIEVGSRFDGGDADRGAGLEAGFNLGLLDTATGMEASLLGRGLILHGAGYRDWGIGFQAAYDPGAKKHGFRLALTSTLGQDGQGRTRLWDQSHLLLRPSQLSPGRSQGRTVGEAAYALQVFRRKALLTPYSRLRSAYGGREVAWGSAYDLVPDRGSRRPLKVELEAVRRSNPALGSKLGVALRMLIPF